MRKIVILIAIITFFSTNILISRTITVKRINGGENGYNVVDEKHEDGGWFTSAKSNLTCIDPGYSACTWNIDPRSLPELVDSGVEYKDLQDYAENQITQFQNPNGNYSDQQTFNGVLYNRTVVWQSNGTLENSQIDITIVPFP